MALTLTIKSKNVAGQKKVVTVDIVPDSSWLAAGESLTPTNVGLTVIESASFNQTGGYVFAYDISAQKVLAYQQLDPADTGGADVPLPAVIDTADLSALTVRAVFIGR